MIKKAKNPAKAVITRRRRGLGPQAAKPPRFSTRTSAARPSPARQTIPKTGINRATYGPKGSRAHIRYAFVDSEFGKILLAATPAGVCSLRLGDDAGALVSDLKKEFAAASLTSDPASLRPLLKSVTDHLLDPGTSLNLPLDIRATPFQIRVWQHLQTIPAGATQFYAGVAAALGRPTAIRAVARACASNNVAIAIPCHRVIRQDGGMGGYRWGLQRKESLLAAERKQKG